MSKMQLLYARIKSDLKNQPKFQKRPSDMRYIFSFTANSLFRVLLVMMAVSVSSYPIIGLISYPNRIIESVARFLLSYDRPFPEVYGVFGFTFLVMILMVFIFIMVIFRNPEPTNEEIYDLIQDLDQRTQDGIASINHIIDTELLPRRDNFPDDVGDNQEDLPDGVSSNSEPLPYVVVSK
jgi:hypothetical protein